MEYNKYLFFLILLLIIFSFCTFKTEKLINDKYIIHNSIINYNCDLNSFSHEMKPIEFNKILSNLLNKNYYINYISTTNKENMDLFLDKILEYINKNIKDKQRKFEVIDKIYIEENKNNERQIDTINFIIYRKNKFYGFQIKTKILIKRNLNEFTIVDIKLIGTVTDNEIRSKNIKGYEKDINLDYNNFDNKILNEDTTLFMENKNKEMKHQQYKCFYNQGFNESTCRSYNQEIGGIGVWDRPCLENTECPFYMKDTGRGGCQRNGECEMPIDIALLGYRYYDTVQIPSCYGCINKYNDKCCSEQKNPRYKFKNDIMNPNIII